jgi:hypothetical protein
VATDGIIIYGREQLPEDFTAPQAQVICARASDIADKLGSAKVSNVVMMGALLEETECLSPATAMNVLEAKVKNPRFWHSTARRSMPVEPTSITRSPLARSNSEQLSFG